MAVGIVTDSVADLPAGVVKRLAISVVPLNVRFGNDVYRDGIDLTPAEFYEKLTSSAVFPITSVPAPRDFAQAYDELSEVTQEIVVVTLSSRLSGTHDVALQSRSLVQKDCRIEVVDSGSATMAEGFVVIRAAEAAQAGASVEEVIEVARRTIPRTRLLATFDTLEYLKRGGRIGAASALVGSVLKINPLIGLRDGLVRPFGRTRSRRKAIERLFEFVSGHTRIDELCVAHSACPEEAEELAGRLGQLFPKQEIYRSQMTPVMGAHTGPGLLMVAVLGDRTDSG